MSKFKVGNPWKTGKTNSELFPGYAKALMEVTDHHLNLFRMVHGGVIFSKADHACEAAGNSFDEPAVAIKTTSISYRQTGPGIA